MTLDSALSRRTLLTAVGLTAGAGAAGSLLGQPAAQAKLPGMTAYHGVTGSVHQQRFNEYYPQGYRMISVSVYGDRKNPRYAAVWVKRSGPAWAAVHGLNASAYQAKVDQLVAGGYVVTQVSATGSRFDPVFAATFEKRAGGTWVARHALTDGPAGTPGTLAHMMDWARDNKCMPTSLTIYGGSGDRTYAGTWHPNPGNVTWKSHAMGTSSGYQSWFNTYSKSGLRPVSVDASDALQYAAIFTDQGSGSWVARHDMTSAQYQAEFDKQTALGLSPTTVQGGGLGSGIRYAAVFSA